MRLWCRFFVIALFFSFSMEIAPAKSKAGPSLDALVDRIDNYWKLLLDGKKLQAAAFIDPSKQDDFLNSTIPQFSEPRLVSLELTADRKEAQVTMTVRRPFPYPFGQMDWPVKGRWVFEKKKWYLIPEQAFIPIPPGKATESHQAVAEKDAAAKREMQQILQFGKSVLDFGTIRQGIPISVKLPYRLTGEKPLSVTVVASAPHLKIVGLNDQSLLPGQERVLSIEVPSQQYAGDVREQLVLIFPHEGVKVPFEFEIKGHVFEPVAVTPKLLKFDLKGDREKIILVRNNLKSSIELESFYSETDIVRIEPLPLTIAPGEELQVKVSQFREAGGDNLYDNLVIRLAQPVDGVSHVRLTAVFNFRDKKNRQNDDPTSGIDIQDLILKNRINLPNH